jgi:hypothetical protein
MNTNSGDTNHLSCPKSEHIFEKKMLRLRNTCCISIWLICLVYIGGLEIRCPRQGAKARGYLKHTTLRARTEESPAYKAHNSVRAHRGEPPIGSRQSGCAKGGMMYGSSCNIQTGCFDFWVCYIVRLLLYCILYNGMKSMIPTSVAKHWKFTLAIQLSGNVKKFSFIKLYSYNDYGDSCGFTYTTFPWKNILVLNLHFREVYYNSNALFDKAQTIFLNIKLFIYTVNPGKKIYAAPGSAHTPTITNKSLKGQCHEIFDPRFFSSNNPP